MKKPDVSIVMLTWNRATMLILNVVLALPSALSGLADMQSISGIKPLACYHILFQPQMVRASLARSAMAVEGSRLPMQWRSRIGTGVGAFPLGWIPFDDVDMRTILCDGCGQCAIVSNNYCQED